MTGNPGTRAFADGWTILLQTVLVPDCMSLPVMMMQDKLELRPATQSVKSNGMQGML